jgi:hypothetical protein
MTSRDVIDFVAIRFLVEGFPTECDVGLALTGAQRPFYSWDSPLCRPKSLQKTHKSELRTTFEGGVPADGYNSVSFGARAMKFGTGV